MNKAHAKYSASGAHRWLTCAASVALSEGMPSTESRAAREGTEAHAWLETYLRKPTVTKPIADTGVDMTLVHHAYAAAEQIRELQVRGADLLIEEKISLECVGPDMFGTVDAAIVEHFKKLTVIDFKYGKSVVSPVENPQLIYYALGLAHLYDFEFEEIELKIIQPRAKVRGETIRSWSIGPRDLEEWIHIFKAGRDRCEDFVADVVSGDHCFFCPAKSVCPAHAEKREFQTVAAFEGL